MDSFRTFLENNDMPTAMHGSNKERPDATRGFNDPFIIGTIVDGIEKIGIEFEKLSMTGDDNDMKYLAITSQNTPMEQPIMKAYQAFQKAWKSYSVLVDDLDILRESSDYESNLKLRQQIAPDLEHRSLSLVVRTVNNWVYSFMDSLEFVTEDGFRNAMMVMPDKAQALSSIFQLWEEFMKNARYLIECWREVRQEMGSYMASAPPRQV